jgi:hypothetical protein
MELERTDRSEENQQEMPTWDGLVDGEDGSATPASRSIAFRKEDLFRQAQRDRVKEVAE